MTRKVSNDVRKRIPDERVALDCLKTLYAHHSFQMPDEQFFLIDCRYSLQLLDVYIKDPPSPEQIKRGIAAIKSLTGLRTPPYELPADSFIESVVKEILEG